MTRTRWILVGGFMASALATGLPYWLLPYSKVNLPDSLYGPGLLVPAAAAAFIAGRGAASFWKTIAFIAGSVVAVVLIRVAVETASDPTSHNLWPFEVLIAFALGSACAFAGAICGLAVSKLRTPGDA